jgi:hypothetical protein
MPNINLPLDDDFREMAEMKADDANGNPYYPYIEQALLGQILREIKKPAKTTSKKNPPLMFNFGTSSSDSPTGEL